MIFAWLLCINLCSKYWCTSATVTVKWGDINLIIFQNVVLSLFSETKPTHCESMKELSGFLVMTWLRNSTSIRILVCWKITVVNLLQIFPIILTEAVNALEEGHDFCMTCKAVSLRPTHTDCHINTACESWNREEIRLLWDYIEDWVIRWKLCWPCAGEFITLRWRWEQCCSGFTVGRKPGISCTYFIYIYLQMIILWLLFVL